MKTNPLLRGTIVRMEKLGKKKAVWRRVAELLEKPRRKKIEVNVGEIDKKAREGEIVVVPGKVLGNGRITKKITVIAFSFSESAKAKIERAGGKTLYLTDRGVEDITPSRVIV